MGQNVQWPFGHDLQKLWAEVRTQEDPGMNLSGQFEKVQTCIAEISALDPGSTSFRYPYDQHGRPVFGHLVVSLRHLQAAIADIGDFLDGVSIEMSVIWQDIPQPQTE